MGVVPCNMFECAVLMFILTTIFFHMRQLRYMEQIHFDVSRLNELSYFTSHDNISVLWQLWKYIDYRYGMAL